MYFEIKIVKRVLCYRTEPDGDWKRFTIHEVARRYMNLAEELTVAQDRIEELEALLIEIDSIRRENYGNATMLHIRLAGSPFNEKIDAALNRQELGKKEEGE